MENLSVVCPTPWLWANFGPCEGDISGFKRDSLLRSKGGNCGQAIGVSVKLWWLEEIWCTELLDWKNLFWKLKWIITNSIRKGVLWKVYPKPCKNKQSEILGSFLRNEQCAHTFSKLFLLNNYVPKWTAPICTPAFLSPWTVEKKFLVNSTSFVT